MVGVPNLTIDEQLHETDASLDQAPRGQAPPTVRFRNGLVDPIQAQCFVRFLRQVECVTGLDLHACGELIGGNARRQLRPLGPPPLMELVEPRDELAFGERDALWFLEVWLEIQYGRSRRSETCALVNRRKVTGTPVVDAVDRKPERVVQYDVGGEVLVFRTEPVRDPGAQRGMPGKFAARVEFI